MTQTALNEDIGEKNLPIYHGHHIKETIYDILSSVMGSAACVYTGQPFDTVKVRMQINAGERVGLVDVFRTTAREAGVTALWRGSVPAFMGAISENAMAFATNGLIKRLLQSDDGTKSVYEPFLSGGVTGVFTAMALCPCDVIKCRSQANIVNGLRAQSVASMVRSIWRKRGPRGLYTGMGAQVLRDVPFYATFFGSYDLLCAAMKAHTDLPETSIYFLAGGFAGQIGWVTSIAPDTIKSRIQTATVPKGIAATAKEIVAARGWRGLFVGVDVAIIRAFPANAALFVAYELSRKAFSESRW